MKICTKLKVVAMADDVVTKADLVDISVVGDHHEFGWVDGFLHVEGRMHSGWLPMRVPGD